MLVGAPLMEAEQDSSIRIEDLPKVVMGRKASRLTEQRLVPSEAGRHVAYPYNRPRSLHRASLRFLFWFSLATIQPVTGGLKPSLHAERELGGIPPVESRFTPLVV